MSAMSHRVEENRPYVIITVPRDYIFRDQMSDTTSVKDEKRTTEILLEISRKHMVCVGDENELVENEECIFGQELLKTYSPYV